MNGKVKIAVRFLLLGVLLAGSVYLLGEDSEVFLKWWLCILTLGLGFWPMARVLLQNFDDKGWLVSKVLGVAVTGFLVWLFTCCKLTKFDSITCMAITAISIALNWVGYFLSGKEKSTPILTQKQFLAAMDGELIFLFCFLAWTYLAAFRPEAKGTEKFMDYGFMMSMMRSDTLPAPDIWYGGETINYYYGGQYFAVFLTKLTKTEVAKTYNLMRTLVAGFAFAIPFVLVRQMVWDFHTSRKLRRTNSANLAGVLAGAGVSLAGNMHYVVVGKLLPWIREVFHLEESDYTYWFPNSTRYIGYYPEGTDKTIHEFPAYSFILGDLHAHVVNVMFVLALICIIYAMIQKYQKLREEECICTWSRTYVLKQTVLEPYIWAFAFFIGLFHWTNFWDFVIYFVMGGFGVIYCNYLQSAHLEDKKEMTRRIAIQSGVHAAWVLLLSQIFALPFTLQFDSMANGIGIAMQHSRPYQWWLIWGLQVVMAVIFLVGIYAEWKKRQISTSYVDWFGVILAVSALGLILIPEFVYVRDIYEAEYARANTMFKLTYQAFILFGLLMAYMFARMWLLKKQYIIKILLSLGLVCFVATCCYIGTAVTSWFGEVWDRSLYEGLDATAFLEGGIYERDADAIDWLNENVEGSPIVLEAQGDSYSNFERVSAMTGLPTVAGWYVHEWLWRGNLQELNERISAVETIYTSDDEDLVRSLLKEYNVEYIYVGSYERMQYSEINERMLSSLGTVAFSDENYNTYIIQVEN